MKFAYILALVLLSSAPQVKAEQDWQLEKNKQGVQVFTRDSALSEFKEFKAITTINASAEQVLATILNPDRLTHWMADTIYAEVITSTAAMQSAYVINKVPFPLDNRDGVFEYQIDKSDPKALKIAISHGDTSIKANDKYVRIASAQGYWLLETQEQGTLVTYQLLLDPGGSIPSWLANSQVVSVPYRTLVNLNKEVLR